MASHQAKLVDISEQAPRVDISQAVPQLQVGERDQKHLGGTKTQ